MGRWAQYMPPVIAAVGGAMYGIDTGIIATTLGHESFNKYMFPPTGENTTLTGAIVSVYNAGQAAGTFAAGWAADRLSRKYAMTLACAIALVGITLQVAAANVGTFISGRLLTGWSSGMILPVVPIYIAEVSKPARRGVVVGFQGMGIAVGFCAANWIGYAGVFARGDAQWRVPLAMQFPCAAFLLVGSALIPFSPRWLVGKDRAEEAREVLARIHGNEGPAFVDREMIQIREQIALERSLGAQTWVGGLVRLFSRQYVRRVALSCFVLTLTQFAGVGVIQNFQSIFYASVGFTGRRALLISGIYGFMGLFGQLISLTVVADRWRRTTTLWVGCLVLAVMLSICMALSAEFADGSNEAASRATIAFIFMYSAAYAIFFNSTTWVVSSELLPLFIRSTGLAFATFCNGVAAIVVSQITPAAMENISWKYYTVFIAANLLGVVVYVFFLPETKGKTLEEIGELFGDTLATAHIGEIDVDGKQGAVMLENVDVGKATK
ncbi:hypothetical protein GTA08_BOTSDO13690 [Neofusicoccum parvum]|uniref:Uncharacterized protein n=1 Tax=Neofusicoccum parvum TaxID=310453 RepID=A0ACB5RTA9_9PEZI|nr:hypothetical protein GTA08_BOTSDO13690 [Neofusicoccum parvum]